ncbi:RING-type domain-containing protein [Citrus sinensis]|uniref:RING-type domain-containing protein n=1 Tax=Citrus sinensis TaxID=2711 RepID=A0ACB8NFW3_CITSI|nr:RING-type domain-containing protein [Citrus sinensis]KAH9797057.1 RING-type domain-containing protein [Citrus sinensis]
MPAQKRSYENATTNNNNNNHIIITPSEVVEAVLDDDGDDTLQRDHSNNLEEQQPPQDSTPAAAADVDGNESDRSRSSGDGEKDEFVIVKLSDIRKEVQCPICLELLLVFHFVSTGIIRKTRTVMECLHRFCRECIDKAMRLGNNECPACRTHCASRRSLRDDLNYDALIAALYPDIDKYEEEELAFQDEEAARNKQIQASIAQTFQRQTEALGRKRTPKSTSALRRSHGRYRDTPLRGRRNYRMTELQGSDENDDANGDAGKDSSSADERSTEVRPKRRKRWYGARFSQSSSAAAGTDGGGDENDSEVHRESMGASVGLIGPSERLAWGKGGIRSHTRHGSVSGSNGKNARNNRLSKLVDYLQSLEEKDDQLDMHLVLVSLDEQRIPGLQQPYLCCRPTLSVRHLCQYVAHQTALQASEIEIYLVKELHSKINLPSSSNSLMIDPCKDKLQVLNEQETLTGLQTQNLGHGFLSFLYLLVLDKDLDPW